MSIDSSYQPQTTAPKQGVRGVIYVAAEFNDLELFYVYYRCCEEGYDVLLAGPETGAIAGSRGIVANVAMSSREVALGELDFLYVPGGKAPQRLRQDAAILETVRGAMAAGLVVGAICHGAQVLASAGVLSGRRITSHPDVREEAEQAGAAWEDRLVTVDGELVTARFPGDLPAFTRELLQRIAGRAAVRAQA